MSRYKNTTGFVTDTIKQNSFLGKYLFVRANERHIPMSRYFMAIILASVFYSHIISASQVITPKPEVYEYQLCVPENYKDHRYCTIWIEGEWTDDGLCANVKNPFPWKSETLLVPKAVEYRSAISGTLDGWLGAGVILPDSACYQGPPSFQYGIETSNVSLLTIMHQNGVSWSGSIGARRDRTVSCPKDYTLTASSCELDLDGIAQDKNLGESVGDFCPFNPRDPVNPGTGNNYQPEIDLPITNSNLRFSRFYNSQSQDGNSSIGTGWRHTYERNIELVEGTQTTTAFVKRPDGKTLYFTLSDNKWTPDEDVHDKLTRTYDGYGLESGWQLTTDNDTKENYDLSGQLTTITYPGGKTLSVTYDPISGQVGQISDTLGNNITLVYEIDTSSFRIKEVQYFSNAVKLKTYQYRYDANNNLEYLDNPDGTTKQYHYEDSGFPNALTGITDERGIRYATYGYDSQGRSNFSTHANNAERVDIIYNNDGTRIVTDSRGNTSTYSTVNQQGTALVSSIAGPGCSSCGNGNTSYVYDPTNNNLLSKTQEGLTTSYGDYDSNGNAGYMIEADGTPEARRTDYTYDPRFISKVWTKSEPSVSLGNTKVTTYDYDDAGNILSISVSGFRPDGTPVSRVINLKYDGPLNQLSEIDGPRSDVSDITNLYYYPEDASQGNNRARLQRVESAGITVRDNIQYTATGKVDSEQRANGLTVSYTYYLGNDRLETQTQSDGVTSQVTRWTYLATGEVETVTLADGTVDVTTITLGYDNARRLTRITDGLGNYIKFTLDTEGNTESTDTYGNGDILHSTLSQTFDAYNRLDTLAQANENSDYDFNADGTLDQVTDGKAQVAKYGYDDLKRLKTITTDLGGSDATTQDTLTQYGYDISGRLNSVIDPNNGTTTYVYDDLGNLLSETSPDTGIRSYTHDEAGNTLELTDAKGQLFMYTYDALNRITYIDAPGIVDDIAYIYDICTNGQGALCYIITSQLATSYDYDAFGNVTSHQGAGYTYNNANRIETITYPSGALVTYGYDVSGQVNRVTLDNNGTVTVLADNITYAPFGSVTNLTYGNGLSLSQGYDSAYRLNNQTVSGVLALDYTAYDANGNLTTRVDNITVATASYTYDALNRLDTANGEFGVRDYDYDRNGNREQLIEDALTSSYSYTPQSNRISTVNGASVPVDANGNITSIHGMTFEHNSQNRIVSIDNGSVNYVYNGLGQRVKKMTGQIPDAIVGDADGNGIVDQADFNAVVDHILEKSVAANDPDCNQDTVVNVQDLVCINNVISGSVLPHGYNEIGFVYDLSGQLIGEYKHTGEAKREYIYLNGQPLALLNNANNQILYAHNDHLGTPQKLTRSNGKVVWSAVYNPFGNATVDEDPDGNGFAVVFNIRFPGQYYDGETGLHYNYFRYYDPSTGRYITSDPIGLQGGLNTYGYVGGNPLNLIDPLGLEGVPAFNPGLNSNQYYLQTNNCYSYALNKPGKPGHPLLGGEGLQPGELSGQPMKSVSCEDIKAAAKRDGAVDSSGNGSCGGGCPNGYRKVKLVITNKWIGNDYHWFRQDKAGGWSSKMGVGAISQHGKSCPTVPYFKYTNDCGVLCVPN